MYGRAGLDRFKKAQSLEPFSVTLNSVPKTDTTPVPKSLAHSSDSYSQSQISHPQTEPVFLKKTRDWIWFQHPYSFARHLLSIVSFKPLHFEVKY